MDCFLRYFRFGVIFSVCVILSSCVFPQVKEWGLSMPDYFDDNGVSGPPINFWPNEFYLSLVSSNPQKLDAGICTQVVIAPSVNVVVGLVAAYVEPGLFPLGAEFVPKDVSNAIADLSLESLIVNSYVRANEYDNTLSLGTSDEFSKAVVIDNTIVIPQRKDTVQVSIESMHLIFKFSRGNKRGASLRAIDVTNFNRLDCGFVYKFEVVPTERAGLANTYLDKVKCAHVREGCN